LVRVISNKRLVDFALRHPDAATPLQLWRKIVEATDYTHFAALRSSFNAVDHVGDHYVFDIGGNKYRLVAAIHFNRQMLFVRHIFTHAEYDRWRPE
jgi:mRNA interferase HigB